MNYETAATITVNGAWSARDCRLTADAAKTLFWALNLAVVPEMQDEYIVLPVGQANIEGVSTFVAKLQTAYKTWEAVKVTANETNRVLTFNYFDVIEVMVADHGVDL